MGWKRYCGGLEFRQGLKRFILTGIAGQQLPMQPTGACHCRMHRWWPDMLMPIQQWSISRRIKARWSQNIRCIWRHRAGDSYENFTPGRVRCFCHGENNFEEEKGDGCRLVRNMGILLLIKAVVTMIVGMHWKTIIMILCIPKQTTVTHGPQLLVNPVRLHLPAIRMMIGITPNLRRIRSWIPNWTSHW